jgi:hypothetical protein
MAEQAAPSTVLDDLAAQIESTADPEKEHSTGSITHLKYNTPKELLFHDKAVLFEVPLLGETWRILAKAEKSRYSDRLDISTYLYDDETDVAALDVDTRDTDHIAAKKMPASRMADDDVSSDTPHMIATILGYYTRMLLDGRDHSYRWADHDEPEIQQLE